MVHTVAVNTAEELIGLIEGRKWVCHDESDFQMAMEFMLDAAGVTFQREVPLGQKSRIDFVVDHTIGLELKMVGRETPIASQLARYAGDPRFTELVLATTSARLAAGLKYLRRLGGKPFHIAYARSW